MTRPLSPGEYQEIFRKVPRLTVEVVVCSERGVLLARRTSGPCRGLWNLPGGTVRFAELLTDAVHRVARDEIGVDILIDDFVGYIEYPSHARQGLDWPVGMAFRTHLVPPADALPTVPDRLEWFKRLPDDRMHDEQKTFLQMHGLVR